ncbi:co-chaperone Hsc20 [Chloroherpeton thalassium ATCC 35110]|uniref:Co-chaperone Hsc20 n=1 Tax=Chloroherpeton thalassium (strain ATCC 35110 / GB-78) TaxID=517418 RepID=B3QSD9_CHLT3|nr:DnaJ domain-containing protein [Chloroherpeton thalassium]ACF12530.1 co-chaperone Hsc20 [Chloroherpeton thalassium ATCC 35110]
MQERNYFELFGIKEKLNLDMKELQQRFYDLSRQVHPDYHQTSVQKDLSLDLSSSLNHAFATLKDRDKRLIYVIERYLGPLQDQKGKKNAPAEMLMELMEMQEKLMEYQSEPTEELHQHLNEMIAHLGKEKENFNKEIDALAEKFDQETAPEKKVELITAIRDILLKKNYIRSSLRTILNTLNPDEL